MRGPIKKLTWEEFIYEMSALGFRYDKDDNSWRRADGAIASDESLRDLHNYWPVLASAALKLWENGAKIIAVEARWEAEAFVSRVMAVE